MRFTLHVPEQLNDGTPTPLERLEQIEEALLVIAGGFTLTHGIGAWKSGDTIYREPVRLYHTDADEADGLLLAELARNVARDLQQEAVYLTATDIDAQLITATAEVLA
jgi:hypothetical protein